jgi:uncharacterized protein (TIGR02266 family)
MSVKTILIAHHAQAVRMRFAAALAEAKHAAVMAGTASELRAALTDPGTRIDLALIDLDLPGTPALDLVADVRRWGGRLVPVMVFAGSLSTAGQVLALSAQGVTAFVNEHAAAGQILPALAPHLFPDNFNRRATIRVPVAVPVSFQSDGVIAGARTQDVSRGGVAIRTLDPLPLGTVLELTFRLPGSTRDITAAGRVAWSDRRVGMGLQFERVEPADQQAIDAFVDGHFFSNRKA